MLSSITFPSWAIISCFPNYISREWEYSGAAGLGTGIPMECQHHKWWINKLCRLQCRLQLLRILNLIKSIKSQLVFILCVNIPKLISVAACTRIL